MDPEEFFDKLIGAHENDEPLNVLDIYFDDEDNPIIPATINGEPTNLDEWKLFSVETPDGETEFLEREDFFKTYMRTRLLFAGAGHG